ncbi:MAG: hypothetical protein EON95_14215, partial [Caulobacteraceae bacterium]
MAAKAPRTDPFGELSPGEQALLSGRPLDLEPTAPVTVRGAFLRSLLAGEIDGAGGRSAIWVLDGLTVIGAVDLSGLEPGPVRALRLSDCRFEGAVCLDGLRLDSVLLQDCAASSVSMTGASLGRVVIDGLTTKGHLKLDGLVAASVEIRRSRIAGVVSFTDARIEGDLAVRASVLGTSRIALQGEHARIDRRLLLDRGVQCDGAVILTAASIDSLRVRGGATVAGPLSLGRARLGDCRVEAGAVTGAVSGGNLTVTADLNLGGEHRCDGGPAIDLSVLNVGGDFALGEGFSSDGPIRLSGCVVGGNLLLQGTLTVPRGAAVDVGRLRCGRLELGFVQLTGGVSLRQVDCAGLVLAGRYHCPADQTLHLGVACAGRVSLGTADRPTLVEGTLSLIGHRCHELAFRNLTVEAGGEGRWA